MTLPRSQTLFGNAVRETEFHASLDGVGSTRETEFHGDGSQTEFGNQANKQGEASRAMGQANVYYVPENQDAWSGRGEELAETLWSLGVFLATPCIMQRLQTFRDTDRPLPVCKLDIYHKFSDMGVAGERDEHPVPNHVYDIKCPSCSADVMDAVYDAWGSDFEGSPKECPVKCPACGCIWPAKDLRFGEPMEFVRFYIFVSDCEQEDWDPKFRKILENIVGPCREYWEWST